MKTAAKTPAKQKLRRADLPLTTTQQETLEWIANYIEANGYPPTFQEIADERGYVSKNAVCGMLESIKAKGYLRLSPGQARTIVVLKQPDETPEQTALRLCRKAIQSLNPGEKRRVIHMLTQLEG